MASVGARSEYWIWPMFGARLSAAARPADGDELVQAPVPVCGSIDSFMYFDDVYMRQTASIAPGARAAEWPCCTPVEPDPPWLSAKAS